MDTHQIDLSLARVMATYYVPEYRRLRIHHQGEDWDLLCFTNPVNDLLKQNLEYLGASPTDKFTLAPYSNVWQISSSMLTSKFPQTEQGFDQRIATYLDSDNQSTSRAGIMLDARFTGKFMQESDTRKLGRDA